MGRHTKHGGYIIEWHKVRNYIVPKDLKDFKVRYYIILASISRVEDDVLKPPLLAHAFRYQEHGAAQGVFCWILERRTQRGTVP